MGVERPVLEYARREEGASGDRYRVEFLLAGVPGVVLLFAPFDGSPSVAKGVLELARSLLATSVLDLFAWVVSSLDIRLVIARAAMMTTPVSLLAWHLLRLGRREPGRVVGGIGFGVALIHAVGMAGILVVLAQRIPWQAPLAGIALVVCGVLSGLAWRGPGWGAFVLLSLLSSYVAFWALVMVQKLMHLSSVRGWPWVWLIVAMVSVASGGVEFVHVFRSGTRDGVLARGDSLEGE